MSYIEAKHARHRALVESLHGGVGGSIRCLPPIELTTHPFPEPVEVDYDDDLVGPGWGPSHVIKDGAKLFFGDLDGES